MIATISKKGWCYGVLLAILSVGMGAAQAADWIYYAKEKDTLWNLCLQYTNKKGCWIELGRYNRIEEDRRIPIGTRIKFPLGWLKQVPLMGRVSSLNGEVLYRRATDESFVPVGVGQELQLGGTLKTLEGSATLLLDGRHRLLLRPHTELELDSFSGRQGGLQEFPGQVESENTDIRLKLPKGSVETEVNKSTGTRFQIQTPSAIAAVRGTRFRVVSDELTGVMRTEVLKGNVAVLTNINAADVRGGYGLAVGKGQRAGAPRELLAAPVFTGEYVHRQLPVDILWQSIAGAKGYRLDIFDDAEQGELFLSRELTQPGYQLTRLAQGCYRLVVSAVDSDGFNGAETEAPLCITPKLETPVVNDTPTREADAIRFTWNAVEHATSYRVEIAADETFGEAVTVYETVTPTLSLAGKVRETFYLRVYAQADNYPESDASAAVLYEPGLGAWLLAPALVLIGIALF